MTQKMTEKMTEIVAPAAYCADMIAPMSVITSICQKRPENLKQLQIVLFLQKALAGGS
jgi:hypothetical protein